MDENVNPTNTVPQENPPVETNETQTPDPANDKLTVWSWIRFFVKLGIVVLIVVLVSRACTAKNTKESLIDAVEHLQLSNSDDLILYWAMDENMEAPNWTVEKTGEDQYEILLTGYLPEYDTHVGLYFDIEILSDEEFAWSIPMCSINEELKTDNYSINYVIAMIYGIDEDVVLGALASALLAV